MSWLASNLDDRAAAAPPSAEIAQIAAFMDKTLGELMLRPSGEPGWLMLTMPAPVAPLEALASAGEPSILWEPPAGPGFAGLGQAVVITASGTGRIAGLRRRADEVWPHVRGVGFAGMEPLQPRFFGGFAFAPGAASAAPWRDFGDARFVLPRWLYVRDGERACLSLTVDRATLIKQGGPAHYLAEFDFVLRLLHTRADSAPGAAGPAGIRALVDIEPSLWHGQIADIRAAILAGHCDKIVAARCTVVETAGVIEPAEVLRSLGQRFSDCYRFGYGFADRAMFVGATPERLIARAGDQVLTEALAGSIAANPGEDRDLALLASHKDRGEQDFVVQTIKTALSPLCSELEVPEQPEIRALHHVLHLHTPIRGRLRVPVHVLDLVAALHPTPAVGGVPTDRAMAWIAEREPAARGWYAAPVGWFDRDGNGELAVAIRSGLLAGNQAYIYAGAGIVRESEADAELAETGLKQRALLEALGIHR